MAKVSINTNAIREKIAAFAKSEHGKSKALAASQTEALIRANEAGEHLAQCVRSAIMSSGLNSGAINAIGDVTITNAFPIGNGRFHVGLYVGDVFRPSLQPDIYGGVDNMAALLNNGYTANNVVYGYWHGNRIVSLPVREGAHFMQHGVENFKNKYGDKYNVVELTISDTFT